MLVLEKRIRGPDKTADLKTTAFRGFQDVAGEKERNREGRIWCTRQELNLEPADP